MTGEGLRVAIAGLDERVLDRERAVPQPGARKPAPDELLLLQAFLNTHFGLGEEWGTDLIDTPDRLAAWLATRRLVAAAAPPPTRAQVQRVLAAREGLRELARLNGDATYVPDSAALARTNAATAKVTLGVELDRWRIVLSGGGRNPAEFALGTMLAVAARAMIDGRWRRLKACPGEHCGWVFYDHSRNNSSRWCSMAVCGGRTKAKSHYRRRRTRAAGGG